jgi:CheY-like chemotaxis protein
MDYKWLILDLLEDTNVDLLQNFLNHITPSILFEARQRGLPATNGIGNFGMVDERIYRGAQRYDHWVPPLLIDEKDHFNPRKYPFLAHAEMQSFLAYREGQPVGRISATIDRHYVEYHKEKTGFFGYFESVEDAEVAAALVAAEKTGDFQKGLELAAKMKPALITLDIMMPIMDGFAVLGEMKADSTLRDIPVIIISAMNDLQSVVKGIEMGLKITCLNPLNQSYYTRESHPALRRSDCVINKDD